VSAAAAAPGPGCHAVAGRLVAVRGPGPVVLPRWRRSVSRPARAVPRLDDAQHAGRTGWASRAWRAGGTGHPDDPGGLTASGAGIQSAVGTVPRDRTAARRTGFGRFWRA